MEQTSQGTVDVAVLGAGLAGLSAARALRQAGLDVVVLEASERVGGRTRSRRLADGALVELGGAWVGPGHTRIQALADAYGLGRFPSYGSGTNRFETAAGAIVPFDGALPASSPRSAAALQTAVGQLDALAEGVDVERPWTSVGADELDAQTFAAWLAANVADDEARAVLRLVCEAVLAVDPADVSLLHLLFYGRASGGLRGLIAIEGGAQDERLVDGTEGISQAMAHELGARVRLGTRVDRIASRSDGVRLSTSSADVFARSAIVAVPPLMAGRLRYDPPLPRERQQLLRRVPPGSAMKCVLVYDEPFWRAAGLSGHGRSLIGPAKGFFDVTPQAGRPGMILGFAEGAQARALRSRPIGERFTAVRTGVARLLGPGAPPPRDYVDSDFSAVPHIGGCYAGYFPPGVWTRCGSSLRTPVERLHWAGTETAGAWFGYMEGAVRSGERAADEVLAELA